MPHKVLPLRMTTDAIVLMDEAWQQLGITTRAEFLRTAISSYLTSVGKKDAAAAVAGAE